MDIGSIDAIVNKGIFDGLLPPKKAVQPAKNVDISQQPQPHVVHNENNQQPTESSYDDSESSIKDSDESSEQEQRIEVDEPTVIIQEDEQEADNDFVTKPTFNNNNTPKKEKKKVKNDKKSKKTKKDDKHKKKKTTKKSKKKETSSSSSSSREEKETKKQVKKKDKKTKRADKTSCEEESPKKKAKKTKTNDPVDDKVNKKKKRKASDEEKEEESPKKKAKKTKNDDHDDDKKKKKKELGEEDQKIEDMRKIFGFNELEEGESYSNEVKQALIESYTKYHDQPKYTKLNIQSPYHRLALYIKANNGSSSSLSPIITRNDFYKIDYGIKGQPKDQMKEVIQSIKQASTSALLINEEKLKLDSFQDQFNYVNNHNEKKKKDDNVVDNNAVNIKPTLCTENDKTPYFLLAQKDGKKYNTFIKPVDKSKQELVVLPQKVFSSNKAKSVDSILKPKVEIFRTLLDKKEEINTLLKSPSSKIASSSSSKPTPKVEDEKDEIITTPKKDKSKTIPKVEDEEAEIIKTPKKSTPKKVKSKPLEEKLPKKLETVTNNFMTRIVESTESSLITTSLTPTITTPTSLSSSSSNPNKVMLKMDKQVQKQITFTPADFAEFIAPLAQMESMIRSLKQDYDELQNKQRKMLARLPLNNSNDDYDSKCH